MISGSAAINATNTTTGSLSYINNLVTGATSQGLNYVIVRPEFLNETMISVLRNTYGYTVNEKPNEFFGTYKDYLISW